MSKTKNKNRREIEYLRGRVRKLEAELKYYKKLPTIEETEPVEDVDLDICERCGKGICEIFDFKFAILRKCQLCGFEERKRKT